MTTLRRAAALLLVSLSLHPSQPARAADRAESNRLAPHEQRDGWLFLFDGRSPAGWVNKGRPMAAANIQDGAINPHQAGAYVTYYAKPFDNFVLRCEFKVTPGANSGVFIRTGDQSDPVQTGFEIQIHDSAGKPPTKHGCGALYDAVAPSADASKKAGEWNQLEITADGPRIQVALNGKPIIDADLDQWNEPGKNPDGTQNKFKKPLKDFPRTGYIGLQDHNAPVWFRNIRVKKLDPGK